MREIVLDTETTGTDPKAGDRLIEIGCVELVNHVQTGRVFHCLVNPMRTISQGAFAVHGISDASLADKPVFGDIVGPLMEFCGKSPLVIHNAPFDVAFLNAEFSRLGVAAPPSIRLIDVIDTLQLARRKHPGASNSLDALCHRYGIDVARRVKHGALLDAQILAEVYVELLGGKQTNLSLAVPETSIQNDDSDFDLSGVSFNKREPIKRRITAEEARSHSVLVRSLNSPSIWSDYLSSDSIT